MTITEKLLIRGLKLFGLPKGSIILTMMLTNTEEKRWAMMDFMVNNQNATEKKSCKRHTKLRREDKC